MIVEYYHPRFTFYISTEMVGEFVRRYNDIYDVEREMLLSSTGYVEQVEFGLDSLPVFKTPSRQALYNISWHLSDDYVRYLEELKEYCGFEIVEVNLSSVKFG
jgi:hypothetical protein